MQVCLINYMDKSTNHPSAFSAETCLSINSYTGILWSISTSLWIIDLKCLCLFPNTDVSIFCNVREKDYTVPHNNITFHTVILTINCIYPLLILSLGRLAILGSWKALYKGCVLSLYVTALLGTNTESDKGCEKHLMGAFLCSPIHQ